MAILYRISPRDFAPDDPSREARSPDGRWHAPGQRVLYFASSLSLCILEMNAQGPSFRFIRDNCHYSQVEAEPGRILRVPESFYREDWTRNKKASQAYGSDWYANRRSLVLEVKSAVLPVEANFVVNTEHADFAGLVFAPASPVPLDPRLE